MSKDTAAEEATRRRRQIARLWLRGARIDRLAVRWHVGTDRIQAFLQECVPERERRAEILRRRAKAGRAAGAATAALYARVRRPPGRGDAGQFVPGVPAILLKPYRVGAA